jgi:hypothetical protein
MTGYGMNGRGSISEISLFSTASRPVLGPTQPPIQWVSGALSPAVRQPVPEVDDSPIPCAEVRNGGAIPSLSHTPSWRGA